MSQRTTPPTWSEIKTWLGQSLKGEISSGLSAPQPDELSTDTRTIKAGEWFVPLEGQNFDGHDYIAQAVHSGAVGYFYKKAKEAKLPQALRARGVAVTDPLEALQAYASGWRSTLTELKMAAVTGSTGKTTTKELLGGIFKKAGDTYATQASFNNEIGVPKTLLQLRPTHRYAALEFGARMPGNIRFLCEMARPNSVGLINVGITHVGVFGSLDNLLQTKLEIFNHSPRDAVQVAYHDDARILAGARATGKKTLSFGKDPAADVQIVAAQFAADGSMLVTYRLLDKTVDVRFRTAHEALPVNGAAAAALALAAGCPTAAIVSGLGDYQGVKGRYQVHRKGDLTIVDDTYNASPDSMLAGLGTLEKSFPKQRKCLVLGDMLELGPISADQHRRVGAHGVARLRPDCLVTVGEEAKKIAEGAVKEGFPAQQVHSFKSVDELIAENFPFARCGEVIYAKASNGIKLSKLIEHLLGPK